MTTTSRANAHTHTVSGKSTSANAGHTHDVDLSGYATTTDLAANISATRDEIAAAIKAHEDKYHSAPSPVPPDPVVPFPWASLQAAINNPPASRIIDCGGRVFNEQFSIGGAGNLRIKNGIVDAQGTRTTYGDITAPSVVLENMRMIRAKRGGTFEMGQPGSLQVGAPRFTAIGLVMTDAWYAGVRIWVGADDCLLQDCDIAGGSVGLLTDEADRLQVIGGAYHDNRDSKSPGNESGGMKLCLSLDVTVKGAKAYNNIGPGIWGDVYDSGMVINGCEAYDNSMAGIMYEISTLGKITNNKAYRNGKTGGNAYQSQTNIFISSSSQVEVQGNTCAFGGAGDIAVVSQNFDGGRQRYSPHAGVAVTNNILTRGPQAYTDWVPGGTAPILTPNTVIPASDPRWDPYR